MTQLEKAIANEKKIEAIIGIFFLITPILGVLFFFFNLFGADGDMIEMINLSGEWGAHWGYDDGASMSPAPIFLGLMALAGVYMVKNSFRYFFLSEDKPEAPKPEE